MLVLKLYRKGEDDKRIESYCFMKNYDNIPEKHAGEFDICEEFDIKVHGGIICCYNCKRFHYIRLLSDREENSSRWHYEKIWPKRGKVIPYVVFDETNKKAWPNIPENMRIYSSSKKCWCAKHEYRNKNKENKKDEEVCMSKM